MIWQLTQQPHRVYPRNPLIAVIVDLRFSPILKIAKGVPEFQDAVRSTFSEFQEESSRFVNLQPLGAIEIREEKIFSFLRDKTKLSLSTGSLTLETRGHHDREELIRDFSVGLEALNQTYSPVHALRLGLRYINLVDKKQLDLDDSVSWNSLINEPFVREPTGIGGADALFNIEVTSPADSKGNLTLRYGLLPEPASKRTVFRLDLDRYIERDFTVSEIPKLLLSFSDDIFFTFKSFAGEALIEWMEGDT